MDSLNDFMVLLCVNIAHKLNLNLFSKGTILFYEYQKQKHIRLQMYFNYYMNTEPQVATFCFIYNLLITCHRL